MPNHDKPLQHSNNTFPLAFHKHRYNTITIAFRDTSTLTLHSINNHRHRTTQLHRTTQRHGNAHSPTTAASYTTPRSHTYVLHTHLQNWATSEKKKQVGDPAAALTPFSRHTRLTPTTRQPRRLRTRYFTHIIIKYWCCSRCNAVAIRLQTTASDTMHQNPPATSGDAAHNDDEVPPRHINSSSTHATSQTSP